METQIQARRERVNDCTTKICSSNRLLNALVNRIRTFMLWTSNSKFVRNNTVKRLLQKKTAIQMDNERGVKIWNVKIWIRLSFCSNNGEKLLKTCTHRLKRCFKANVKFVTPYDTKKCTLFCSKKDKIPIHQKSNTVYIIKCPEYDEHYVTKTDRHVTTRLNEQSN